MWFILLGMLLGLAQAQSGPLEQMRDDETPNAETPYFVTMNFQIETIIKRLLLEQQEYIEDRLQTLESKIEETCVSNEVQQQTEEVDLERFTANLADLMNTLVGKMSEVADATVDTLEGKLNTLSSDVLSGVGEKVSSLSDDLAEIQQQMSSLASQTDLVQLKSKISTLATTKTAEVKSLLSTVATEAMVSSTLQELANTELAEIKQMISNFSNEVTACDNEEILNRILTSVASTKEDTEELAETLGAAASQLSDRHTQNAEDFTELFQSLIQEVDRNEEALTGVTGTVTKIESDVTARLTALQTAVDEINNNTQPPPPPPPTTTTSTTTTSTTTTRPPTTTTAALVPCLDSNFRGKSILSGIGRGKHFLNVFPSNSICTSAVGFNKCHLQYVSYHCCRSCTDAGLLPPMGPWRYLNYPRDVNILEAFSFMRS